MAGQTPDEVKLGSLSGLYFGRCVEILVLTVGLFFIWGAPGWALLFFGRPTVVRILASLFLLGLAFRLDKFSYGVADFSGVRIQRYFSQKIIPWRDVASIHMDWIGRWEIVIASEPAFRRKVVTHIGVVPLGKKGKSILDADQKAVKAWFLGQSRADEAVLQGEQKLLNKNSF